MIRLLLLILLVVPAAAQADATIVKLGLEQKQALMRLLTETHVGRLFNGTSSWFYSVGDELTDATDAKNNLNRPTIYTHRVLPVLSDNVGDIPLLRLERFDACDQTQYTYDFTHDELTYEAVWGDPNNPTVNLNSGLIATLQTMIGQWIGSKPSIERAKVLELLVDVEGLVSKGREAEAREKLLALAKSCPVPQSTEYGK